VRSRLSQRLGWTPVPPIMTFLEATPGTAEAVALTVQQPGYKHPLTPRDEAIFLLHVASEIEHSLMVQYLYAWLSLHDPADLVEPDDPDDPQVKAHQQLVGNWAAMIRDIAIEEMGHLASVQNILRLIGGPIAFEREDYPFLSTLYPFPFRLEKLTKDSLAKYVFTEMPSDYNGVEAAEIRTRAMRAAVGFPINHVGMLYARLIELFQDHLSDDDFHPETIDYQVKPEDWGSLEGVILQQVRSRSEAVAILQDIKEQGEGASMGAAMEKPHFQRFLDIYSQFPEEGDWVPTRNVPTNPNTAPDPQPDATMERGRLQSLRALQWAALLNLRYRMLLTNLMHIFHLSGPMQDEQEQATPRGYLRNWSVFGAMAEMHNLAQIARYLTTIPQYDAIPAGPVAGPSFEMPYTLQLPDLEADRWLLHRDLILDADLLIEALLAQGLEPDEEKRAFLGALADADRNRRETVIEPLIRTLRPPKKVTDIKELRLLPALAIARLGSSLSPMDNYDAVVDPQDPTGYRILRPAETLAVDPAIGEVTGRRIPESVQFRDEHRQIRPVAPFLEVWVRFEDDGPLTPLMKRHLDDLGLSPASVQWRVRVANHKVFRRTRKDDDKVEADTGAFSDHAIKELRGTCNNFKAGKFIPFGAARYIQPNDTFPEVRLRFTPGPGKVYGPTAGDPNVVDDVYDATQGTWLGYTEPDNDNTVTIPVNIFAQDANGASRGYFDDACDGMVHVALTVNGKTLQAYAHISSGPPDFAPDSFLVRTVADELEQMLFGPQVTETADAETVMNIIRRGLETVSLMQTEVLNGTFARNAFTVSQANYAHARTRHAEVLQALQGLKAAASSPQRAAAVDNLRLVLAMLREYTRVGDETPEARRQMPAMMRGADGRRLALTRRQRALIEKAVGDFTPHVQPPNGQPGGSGPEQAMINIIMALRGQNAIRHLRFDVGNGKHLSDLFQDPPALLNYLKTANVRGDLVPAVKGKPLIVPGKPAESAFITLLEDPAHPMHTPFTQTDPATNKPRIEVVREWITSLS